MTLISSISGIRGTIGGKPNDNLTPEDIVRFTKAYANFIKNNSKRPQSTVIIGRDARVTGEMVEQIVTGTLSAMGIHSLSLGLSTTPTTEMAVVHHKADGGIIITASHNPEHWNALKLLNSNGEFLTKEEGLELEHFLKQEDSEYSPYNQIGSISKTDNFITKHVETIIQLPLVDIEAIRYAQLTIVADAINSTGAIALPLLFEALGVAKYYILNGEPNGLFAHNAEPLPAHLTDLSQAVVLHKADVGIAVDPDVDRLALVMENGQMFGEEYTLVAVADYVLKNQTGNTVSNMSSTQALKIVTEQYGGTYASSAVGEVNVVQKMKETKAVIGGEGNGGVIYPKLHYGRDALAGIALFLTYLAKSQKTMSELRKTYPNFYISKQKIELKNQAFLFSDIADVISKQYQDAFINKEDGLKIIFPTNEWVHLRPSNTEPIIRIYAESNSEDKSIKLASRIKKDIEDILNV
jgi:phosphomannomutase